MVDGYVSLNNERLFFDINTYKRDLKQRGGWSGIFFVFIGMSVFANLKNEKYFNKIFHYFDFGLRIMAMLAIVAIVYYLFF